MQLIDPTHPFYRPFWRRALIVAVCLSWAVIEASTNQPFWAILVGAAGIYAAWVLLVNFNPEPPEGEAGSAEAGDAQDGAPGGGDADSVGKHDS